MQVLLGEEAKVPKEHERVSAGVGQQDDPPGQSLAEWEGQAKHTGKQDVSCDRTYTLQR